MVRIERPQRQAGFAYLWVLLSVALLSVGFVLVLEMDATALRRDQERELLAIGHQFRWAIERYYAEVSPAGIHEYPERLEDLLLDHRGLVEKRHLRKVFVDPMSAKAEWGFVRGAGRIMGVYSLSDRKPIKQDGFEAEDAAFRNASKYREWVFAYSANLSR
jgi:hypothetical protein